MMTVATVLGEMRCSKPFFYIFFSYIDIYIFIIYVFFKEENNI